MDQSKNYKLIVLGNDHFFVEEIISIVATRYSSVCVPLNNFAEFKEHCIHSIPPDGVILQSGHHDVHLIQDFIKLNDLNILVIVLGPKDFIVKVDTYFSALKRWFSVVPYLPLSSNIAGFIGYTPVDLYIKNGTDIKKVIEQKSFISENSVKDFFSEGHGFFFMKREDRADYEEDWGESTLAYFKSNTSIPITQNGPMGLLIPFLESTYYHGIPEADQYILYSALERISFLLQANQELSGSILKILQKNSYQLKHTSFLMCMNIATMSALGIGSSVVYFNITLAALIHDIGTLSYGFEEYEFNEFAMEKMLEESIISSYSRHAEASLSLLVKYQICPRWVAEVVLSHHENDDGFGYPLGINSSSLGLASFLFAYNHEWAEKLYGFMVKEKTKIDRNFYIEAMPKGSDKARELKSKILNHLNFALR